MSMETLCLKLDRNQFSCPSVEVDVSLWPMSSKYHMFFFTRIFYLFEFPAYEQVGECNVLGSARADFLLRRLVQRSHPGMSKILRQGTWEQKVPNLFSQSPKEKRFWI